MGVTEDAQQDVTVALNGRRLMLGGDRHASVAHDRAVILANAQFEDAVHALDPPAPPAPAHVDALVREDVLQRRRSGASLVRIELEQPVQDGLAAVVVFVEHEFPLAHPDVRR